MLSSLLLHKIHFTLQQIFENDEPFGNISILAVGDLLQLPPVAATSVFGPISMKRGFHSLISSVWQNHFLLHELTEIVRQQEDPEFACILSRIRTGDYTNEDGKAFKMLESNDTLPDDCLSLFCLNVQAEMYNMKQLEKISSRMYVIEAYTSSKDKHTNRLDIYNTIPMNEWGGLPPKVTFAVGEKYLHLKNTDLTDGIVNGAKDV